MRSELPAFLAPMIWHGSTLEDLADELQGIGVVLDDQDPQVGEAREFWVYRRFAAASVQFDLLGEGVLALGTSSTG